MSEWYHRLGYTQHGGSGYGWPPSEIDRLGLEEIAFFIERLQDERKEEKRLIDEATKRR